MTATPVGIQRLRTKGATHPEGTLYVTRGKGETAQMFGNPHRIKRVKTDGIVYWHVWRKDGTEYGETEAICDTERLAAEKACRLYDLGLGEIKLHTPDKYADMMRRVQAAKFVACTCKIGEPCHRDILIRRSTEFEREEVERAR